MLYNNLGLLNTRWALIIPNIAGGPIFGIFLMRAFITGIPEEVCTNRPAATARARGL